MMSAVHIDPSLCDMSFADAFNLVTTSTTSQDSRHHGADGADGNSIPGGEPVHCSAFFFLFFPSPD
jgi:hypothetical protein